MDDRDGRTPLDRALVELARRARVLPALHPQNAVSERARLTEELEAERVPVPRWQPLERRDVRGLVAVIDQLRRVVGEAMPEAIAALYRARLEELELDVALLDALGDARRVRPIAARRFGTGADVVEGISLRERARTILADVSPNHDARVVSARELATRMERAAREVGLELTVKIDPRLSAGAAAGDRTIYLQDRAFGAIEARRLVAHEVLGHAVAAHRGANETLAIFEVGTAGSFADQEGLAIVLEEEAGALDALRLRVLAARVLATDRMHEGASFGETARELVKDVGLSPSQSISTTERAFRGGGVARDAGYLAGWLRVRGAIREGSAALDHFRMGRVSTSAMPAIRWAITQGLASTLPPPIALGEVLDRAGCTVS
ncbi:MAG: DUF1704 domain-containing protein [Deltaproteobacteria bacterium]|nr:DUF1704 domain-containing protein [Deltaproteobacteria bacterium]